MASESLENAIDEAALDTIDSDIESDSHSPIAVSEAHLKSVLESLVFVAEKPVTAHQLAKVARAPIKEVKRILADLQTEYHGRGLQLEEVASGFQFRSAPGNAPFVRDLVGKKPQKMSRAQIEALAVVAYRQPVTRPEIEEIRGVDCGHALKFLLERDIVKVLGRKEEPGRPLLYGTTPKFLEMFSLSSLKDLPTLHEFSELTEESRALFEKKTGERLDNMSFESPDAESQEAAHGQDDAWDAVSDEELAELARRADEEESQQANNAETVEEPSAELAEVVVASETPEA